MSAEVKTVAAAVGVAATVPAMILGIHAATLAAATAGALFSLAYSRPDSWGGELALPEGPVGRRMAVAALRIGSLSFTLAANAMVAAWAVSTLPHLPGLQWTGTIPEPPLAGLIAFAGQHVVPRLLAWASRWLDARGAK